MSQIKALLFDVGGVLNLVNFKKFHRELSDALGIDDHEFSKINRELVHEFTKGKLTLNTFFKKLSNKVGKEITSETYIDFLHEYIDWNTRLFDYLKSIKGSFKFFILSNNCPLFITKEKREELSEIFEKQFYSYELKELKPDEEFFAKTLIEIPFGVTECLFIDDKKSNVDTAKKLGMQSFEFKSNEEFFDYMQTILIQD